MGQRDEDRRGRVRRFSPHAAFVLVLALASAPAPVEARGGCVAGAAGAGDPYYPTAGNGGYQVRQYDLDLRYDPATDRLDGTASIRATAKRRLCSFNLDLVGLDVATVRVDGERASVARSDEELTVTPTRPLEEKARFEAAIRYGGVPVAFPTPRLGLPTGFMATSDGTVVAGGPKSASAWFPVNDHPSDKASYSFEVTVPPGYEVVANGKPRGRQMGTDGWTAWRWEAPAPMASYLATIDVGYWDVTRRRTKDGVMVYDAVDPAVTGALRAQIDSSLARQGEVLDLLSAAFGPYPFDAAGAIVDPERPIPFALETQTRPVYWAYLWTDDQGTPTNADYLVVHELAHQWFGDDVALERWRDIWLNEGFATYAEWLWLEHERMATVRQTFDTTYNSYPADDPLWSVVVGDPGPEHQFAAAVYVRGAMTLQALRQKVGDRSFWKLIRRWAKRKGDGHGTTRQFIAMAKRISGRELDAFFETWLFTPSKPPGPASSRAPGRARAFTARTHRP